MVDSGASSHFFDPFLMPGWRSHVRDYVVLEKPFKVYGLGGHVLDGVAQGTIWGTVLDENQRRVPISLSVYIVPGLGRNLMSVKASANKGVVTIFENERSRLQVAESVLPLTPPVSEDLYSFELKFSDGSDNNGVAFRAESANLWHRRVGHVNARYLDVLRRIGGNGVEFTGDLQSCDVCAIGKSSQQPHPKVARNDIRHPFQLVTIDLLGEIRPPALGNFKYISKIVDQFSKWSEVYLLKTKADAVDSLQLFNQHVVIPSGYRLARIRGDRGGEFTGQAFRSYCQEIGSELEFAATNTPQQIGANERAGRTLASMVRCMLADSGLPHFLWGELFMTASYLCNRAPHSALNYETPYKILRGKNADLRHLRVVGARAFVHVETHKTKLEPRA
ncbi:unnamed protein product, partial [Scytosiphon promiscuus]